MTHILIGRRLGNNEVRMEAPQANHRPDWAEINHGHNDTAHHGKPLLRKHVPLSNQSNQSADISL